MTSNRRPVKVQGLKPDTRLKLARRRASPRRQEEVLWPSRERCLVVGQKGRRVTIYIDLLPQLSEFTPSAQEAIMEAFERADYFHWVCSPDFACCKIPIGRADALLEELYAIIKTGRVPLGTYTGLIPETASGEASGQKVKAEEPGSCSMRPELKP